MGGKILGMKKTDVVSKRHTVHAEEVTGSDGAALKVSEQRRACPQDNQRHTLHYPDDMNSLG